MELKNLPWYSQLGIFLGVGVLLLVLFYFIHYEGTQKTIKRKNNEIASVQNQINAAKIKLRELDQIRAEIKMNEKRLAELDKILPKTKNISRILTNIQSLISATQQEFKKMSKGTKKNQKLFVEYSYVINSSGNFHNLGTFFDHLSNLKKIFNITSLSISPRKSKVFSPQFTIDSQFRISTYVQRRKVKKKSKR